MNSITLKQVWDSLGISKWTGIKTLLFGGWADLAIIVCNAFTKLLRKAKAEMLAAYAEFAEKIAKIINFVVELFVKDDDIKKAAISTCNALSAFASHVKDGEYTPAELDEDIDNIEKCVADWKSVAEKK